jgi:uncharacterized protein YcbX
MTIVGHVAGLFRYPVKSMRAEQLNAVEVSWQGLAGDRRWAFIRESHVGSGFPWLTVRERPEMALCRPRFAEPERPDALQTLVNTPSGEERTSPIQRSPANRRALSERQCDLPGILDTALQSRNGVSYRRLGQGCAATARASGA